MTSWFQEFVRCLIKLYFESEITPKSGFKEKLPYCTQTNNTRLGFTLYMHFKYRLFSLGWNSLDQRRLLQQSTMFFKIHQGLVGIMFPNEVHPLNRKSQLPNPYPYRQLQCNNNIYKYSFYPRTIVTWNNLPLTSFPNTLSSFKTSATPAL